MRPKYQPGISDFCLSLVGSLNSLQVCTLQFNKIKTVVVIIMASAGRKTCTVYTRQ